jgi:hypothetical protein
MVNHRASSSIFVVGFVLVVCVSTLTADSAHAQQTLPAGPPPPGSSDPFAEARERRQREAQLRSAEMVGTAKPTGRRASEAAAEQLREDFRNIQILRNKLVRHLQSNKPLNYKFIANETGEINKRAGRLKAHLLRASPESEKTEREKKEQEPQAEIGDGQVSDALVTMCMRIDSFTESPVFKTPDVIDLKESDKAGRDLRDIIQLSGGIRKTAERLNKTSKK